jgi:hypothetical protein
MYINKKSRWRRKSWAFMISGIGKVLDTLIILLNKPDLYRQSFVNFGILG